MTDDHASLVRQYSRDFERSVADRTAELVKMIVQSLEREPDSPHTAAWREVLQRKGYLPKPAPQQRLSPQLQWRLREAFEHRAIRKMTEAVAEQARLSAALDADPTILLAEIIAAELDSLSDVVVRELAKSTAQPSSGQ